MKKILMILICGFAFTQSIQTKELFINLDESITEIDISNYVTMESNELYIVRPFYITNFTTDCSHPPSEGNENGWEINFRTSSYPLPINQAIEINYECDRDEEEDPWECEYYFENEYAVLSLENSILNSYFDDFYNSDCSTFSGGLYLRISGVFEDDSMFDTGDLNQDGNINVVDVVVLVNSILGIG